MRSVRTERGEEPWFGLEVGLPMIGLDPTKDCNHVSNEELRFFFGEKELKRGYIYTSVKVVSLRTRVEELFRAVFQTQSLPEGDYIPESFARAVVSEVCHLHPMNWARYAADRWNGKKNKKKSEYVHLPIVRFQEEKTRNLFRGTVIESLDSEIKAMGEEHDRSAAAHHAGVKKVESLLSAQPTPLLDYEREKLQLEVKFLYPLLQKSEQLLDRIQKMKPLYMRSGNDTFICQYKSEVERELGEVEALRKRIRFLEDQLNVTDDAVKSALEEEKRLSTLKMEQWSKLQDLKGQRGKFEERSTLPLFRYPSRFIEEPDQATAATSKLPSISVLPCSLCRLGFPNLDIIIAPCLCTYHPWCVTMQTWLHDTCANGSCKKNFPEGWKRSFGLSSIPGKLLCPS